MLFNSVHFLIFFPVVTSFYFLLPHRFRWALLLAASCYFYMVFKPVYILILAFMILVDYTAGILIEESPIRRRKAYLVASICANVGVLAFFKYYNFFNQSLRGMLDIVGLAPPVPPLLNLLLPIGLSFHAFQSLSYTIEVYRGKQEAERHLGIFALYVMFYPQLVAGPIERPQNLLHQFRERHYFDYERVVAGLQLMMWGFFKKMVIADRLAPFVSAVYDDPRHYHGISFIVTTVFCAFQVYCDFSGYSDIALGSAQVMGFKLTQNFDRPYFSKSVSELWRRWHISLTTWFRDYLFAPLCRYRFSRQWMYFSLFLVFLTCGLWHGANWTFIVWGGIQGGYIIVGDLWRRTFGVSDLASPGRRRWRWPVGAVRVLRTFALWCFAAIFFRANSLRDAGYIISHLFDGFGTLARDLRDSQFFNSNIFMGLDKLDFKIALWALGLLLAVEALQQRYSVRGLIARQRLWLRWSFYYASLFALLYFGAFVRSRQFIYFQF